MKALCFLGSWAGAKFLVNLASAIFGLLGTWLMSRRYANQLIRSLLYSLISPALYLFGKGARVRRFFKAKIDANRDMADSITEMVWGLTLLFWAFFLQLTALFMDFH